MEEIDLNKAIDIYERKQLTTDINSQLSYFLNPKNTNNKDDPRIKYIRGF